MATRVGWGTLGDGQSSTVTQLSFTLPTVQTGDRLHVYVDSSDSGLTFGSLPSGSSVIDGPRANGSSAATAIIEKTLDASDSGTTFTIPWTSGAARAGGEWVVYRGTSGTTVVAVTQDTSAVTNFVMPTISGVAAGSVQQATTLRRRSGASANNTSVPSPYTAMNGNSSANDWGTSYGSGVNVFGSAGYLLSSSSGTVGGETFVSGGVSSLGTNYLVVIPTGPQTGSGTLTQTGSGTTSFGGKPAFSGVLARTGSGSLSLTGAKIAGGTLAQSGSGSLSMSGKPSAGGVLARTGSGVLTVNSLSGQGSLAVAGSGALVLSGRPAVNGALTRTGAGALTLGGKLGARGTLARTGSGALTLDGRAIFRFSWWNGTKWVQIVPRVEDGTTWRSDIEVTVVPSV